MFTVAMPDGAREGEKNLKVKRVGYRVQKKKKASSKGEDEEPILLMGQGYGPTRRERKGKTRWTFQ